MKSGDKIAIFKNVGSSWSALGLNILIGLFLSPYILHHLGDEAFGLWVLIFSITGYYGLFDLGIRSSIIRYVAKYSAVGENEELNRLINTALFAYSGIGAVVLLITIVASFYVDSLFRISGTSSHLARWLFLMVGSAVALGFPLGVFGGILEGLQRFYVLNIAGMISTLARTLLIVIALQHGRGLLTVALITVGLPLLTSLVNATAVLHILPLRFGLKHLNRESLRSIASYSGTTFILIVAVQLRFKTDAMIIGRFLSSAAITYFTIGSRLVDYAGEVVGGLAQMFVPMSSQSDATGDLSGLRKIFVAGNRACALIIFPMTAILIILGKSVIEAWVGARYISVSYPVLLVLIVPSTLMLAQGASYRIMYGMARHKPLAIVTLMEGGANLFLSILLVRPFGIVGDAVGTAIPLACTTLFFLPRHLCRVLKLGIGVYLRQAFLLPLMLCAPLVAVLLLMRRWFVPHNYFQLVIQLLVGSVVYGVGLLWAVWTRKVWLVEGIHDQGDANQIAVALIETSKHEEF